MGAFKQNQASPVQGEVGFAQQNSEGLLHKILQNDGKTLPQSLCRSPLCWGEPNQTATASFVQKEVAHR